MIDPVAIPFFVSLLEAVNDVLERYGSILHSNSPQARIWAERSEILVHCQRKEDVFVAAVLFTVYSYGGANRLSVTGARHRPDRKGDVVTSHVAQF